MTIRCIKISLWAIFSGMITLPSYVFPASITETSAIIGEGCEAAGKNSIATGYYSKASGTASTAMGYYTEASETASTAMGSVTAAGGFASTAVGSLTKANGKSSFAGGRYMNLTSDADYTFVWGRSESEESISAADAFLIFPAGTPGKVGIGTNNPYNLVDLGSTLGKKLAVYQGAEGNSFYGFGISSGTLEIYAGADVPDGPAVVVKRTTGRVGIGTADPAYLLEVNGDAAKPGGGSWSVASDKRLKVITGMYKVGLAEISELEPITFHYKEGNPRDLPFREEYIGFVAQETQRVFPEAVTEGPDGYLDFNMHPVNVALVNAIKELKAQNDKLQADNSLLKKEIEKIKAVLGITEETGI